MLRMRIARLHCWLISLRNAGKIASALFLKTFGHVAFDCSQKLKLIWRNSLSQLIESVAAD